MRFVKLEGDAVFCYAEGETFEQGERFVELVEACYFDFANRLRDMERGTTLAGPRSSVHPVGPPDSASGENCRRALTT